MIKARLRSVIFVLFGILLAISPVFVYPNVYAQQATLDADDFNPNYLISDEEMQNYQSMTRADIQAFLEDYNSSLKDYHAPDENGTNRLASDIIYRASLDNKINPKYLLVKLQKEQSLITDQNPTQKQLDGATGYGITDSCGWSCDSYLRNKGFGMQVAAAAGIMRWYYDHVDMETWIKRPHQTVIIDGQVVIPQNYATAFLYTYTPHIQGNKNFWTLWNRWFSQVYPNGTLTSGYNSPTVYLIQNGQKREITSMAVLMTRFDPKMIIKIPDSELNNIPTGSKISLPNYSILKQGSKYYLVDFDTIRPFANYDVVKSLGYNPGEIVEVDSNDISDYKIGETINANTDNLIGRVVKIKETGGFYYLKDKLYYPLTDEKIAKVNFPNLTIENATIQDLQGYKLAYNLKFQDGTLIGINGDNKIYVMEDGKKRHIASEEVYNAYGYDWKNIVWTNEITGMNHPTGQPIYMPTRLASQIENNIGNIATTNTESTPQTTTQDSSTPKVGILQTTTELIDGEKMYIIPEEKTVYIGEKFETNVDTYLVADYDTQEILAGKNIDIVRPTASFTKVLTAYQLMKEGIVLTRYTTYNSVDHRSAYHMYRIAEGEKILNQDLLYAMLISSLNTPARMLVDSVEKEESLFINKMNEQIKEWGLTKSKFYDVYGFDIRNVTTAREYMTIFINSDRNKEVHSALSMKNYEYDEILDLDNKPHHFDNNSNELMNKNNLPFDILASKTGCLNVAGEGLAMIIERPNDNRKFIIITMGNPDTNTPFSEPERLSTWAISNF